MNFDGRDWSLLFQAVAGICLLVTLIPFFKGESRTFQDAGTLFGVIAIIISVGIQLRFYKK
jgi:hypothetical protein